MFNLPYLFHNTYFVICIVRCATNEIFHWVYTVHVPFRRTLRKGNPINTALTGLRTAGDTGRVSVPDLWRTIFLFPVCLLFRNVFNVHESGYVKTWQRVKTSAFLVSLWCCVCVDNAGKAVSRRTSARTHPLLPGVWAWLVLASLISYHCHGHTVSSKGTWGSWLLLDKPQASNWMRFTWRRLNAGHGACVSRIHTHLL